MTLLKIPHILWTFSKILVFLDLITHLRNYHVYHNLAAFAPFQDYQTPSLWAQFRVTAAR